jgi:hypothetical protein
MRLDSKDFTIKQIKRYFVKQYGHILTGEVFMLPDAELRTFLKQKRLRGKTFVQVCNSLAEYLLSNKTLLP